MEWIEAASIYYKRTWGQGAGIASLPCEWQRELVALMLVGNEICNGGYLQFLTNHGRETYALASHALKKIGAVKSAEIIDSCQSLVDEHSPIELQSSNELTALLLNEIISREGKTIKEAGSVLPDAVLRRISELSYEFMEFPDDYGTLAEQHYQGLIESDENGCN